MWIARVATHWLTHSNMCTDTQMCLSLFVEVFPQQRCARCYWTSTVCLVPKTVRFTVAYLGFVIRCRKLDSTRVRFLLVLQLSLPEACMRDSSGQNVDFFRMDGNTENRERLRKITKNLLWRKIKQGVVALFVNNCVIVLTIALFVGISGVVTAVLQFSGWRWRQYEPWRSMAKTKMLCGEFRRCVQLQCSVS